MSTLLLTVRRGMGHRMGPFIAFNHDADFGWAMKVTELLEG